MNACLYVRPLQITQARQCRISCMTNQRHSSARSDPNLNAAGDAIEIIKQFDTHLEALLPGANVTPQRLHRAMRHAILAGGKRLRPQLLLLVAESCSKKPWTAPVVKLATLAACALEMIHTASLIHDDL